MVGRRHLKLFEEDVGHQPVVVLPGVDQRVTAVRYPPAVLRLPRVGRPPVVLLVSYTPAMAKVMVSLPDDLLGALDAEAQRRHTSRSALLRAGACRELGLLRRERADVLADLDALSRDWAGPVDAAALIRAERLRDG